MREDRLWTNLTISSCSSGGVGSIEEEGGWCVYVQCLDCGAHTAELSYKNDAERLEAARMAARTWNYRKVIRPNPGE